MEFLSLIPRRSAPRETPQAARKVKKRLFSQASDNTPEYWEALAFKHPISTKS